jgi:maltooligosyltrehalose trehalohydrolase
LNLNWFDPRQAYDFAQSEWMSHNILEQPAMNSTGISRKHPAGAEILPGGGAHFRVWAPLRRAVEVVSDGGTVRLESEGGGYFSGVAEELHPGALYRYRLDGTGVFPDPASRFQPEGPHGPSQIVDPDSFRWTDQEWRGLPLAGQVIYELHVGTFTPEGTWRSAAAHLADLADTGITVIELMPVADFSGQYGWGYDGVNWFAPTRLYGAPDDFRAFVDQAHSLGLAVILDVVYNHFGSDGNYIGQFSPYYSSKAHKTDWGDAINYDGEHSGPVREFVTANAAYWIDEYHLDGLRLDATQDIFDGSRTHILAELTAAVRQAAKGRQTIVVAENEPQDTRLVRPADRGGHGIDGLWNDDYHHTAIVTLTGHTDAYYTDYRGTPQELLSAMKYGYLYQGQWYKWQKRRRGTPSFDIEPCRFITYIQNHDQVANSGRGHRGHLMSHPALYRAITAVMLLGPGTPMLFQGQEFGAETPFLYFADVPDCLRETVQKGRREFLAQWRSLRTPEMSEQLKDPCTRGAFEASKLDRTRKNQELLALHRDLLTLRRSDPVLRVQRAGTFDGAVISTHAFLYRIFNSEYGDRLLVVNLGPDLHLDPAPEPLLAPFGGQPWRVSFSTEHPRYGGYGTPPLDTEENWQIPGYAAVLLVPGASLSEMRFTETAQIDSKI